MRNSLATFGTATLLILLLFAASLYYLIAGRSVAVESNQSIANGYGSPVQLAQLENQSIKESSGLAASKRNPEMFWTHNDSGDGPFIYAFDRRGKHRGIWRVTGATALDWEDMAIGPGPAEGQSYIYIGDIGDNGRSRHEIIVYRIAEPSISSDDSSSTTDSPRLTDRADAIRLTYPDGKYDAEALLIHPLTGDLYIVTKSMAAPARVYKLKAPHQVSGVSTLTHVGEIRLPNQAMGFITGGAISPDGLRVILCDYLGACEFVLEENRSGFDAIWKQPPVQIDLGPRKQGESICYRSDGLALMATSERLPCPLIEVERRLR
ncbi:MAG TPA: hypothetical protein VIG62_13620 [Blastocatellia bacterium]|jgi:hypothetical protein